MINIDYCVCGICNGFLGLREMCCVYSVCSDLLGLRLMCYLFNCDYN